MTDIVERLRDVCTPGSMSLRYEAAALIVSLREALEPMFKLHIDLDTPKGIAHFRSLDEAEAFADFLANIDDLRTARALVKPAEAEGKSSSE